MAKKILFILLGLISVGVSVWFYMIQKRNGYIDLISNNTSVTRKDFNAMSTAQLSAWADHLKDLDKGSDVSYRTFTFNGKTYNLRTGDEQ